MAALLNHIFCVPGLEIVEVDRTFFGAAEDADDAPDAGSSLEEWEEVEDEAGAGVVLEGCA